jgi:hypothetical protein
MQALQKKLTIPNFICFNLIEAFVTIRMSKTRNGSNEENDDTPNLIVVCTNINCPRERGLKCTRPVCTKRGE